MTAWVIGQFLTREDLLDGGTLIKVHDGPYVQTYRWTRHRLISADTHARAGHHPAPGLAPRRVSACASTGARWAAEGGIPHLRVRFPLAVDDPQPRYEIPFGSIRATCSTAKRCPPSAGPTCPRQDRRGRDPGQLVQVRLQRRAWHGQLARNDPAAGQHRPRSAARPGRAHHRVRAACPTAPGGRWATACRPGKR